MKWFISRLGSKGSVELTKTLVHLLLAAIILLAGLAGSEVVGAAPGSVTSCSSPINISNSPGFTSADPFVLADPTGTVHLFWAEKATGQPNESPNIPDTVMYSSWNGRNWSEPVDIFISPPENFNRKIAGIRGVLDDKGRIHLVWMGPDDMFFYGSVYAADAGNAQAWHGPELLADDQTGTQYSVGITYQAPDTLHIIYGSDPANSANRVVSYIRSLDNGQTWSTPTELHAFPDPQRGASNTRIHTDPFHPERVYATWTEWDETGNGQVIYFARSLNRGDTWAPPVPLAIRVGNEYQRDWTNLVALDEDQLMVFWSGGFRAYPQSQYSYDGGVTWTDAIDTLYWLIADNGYAEFIRDHEDRLHLFITRRVREGYGYKCENIPECSGEGNAIWHSVWQGGTSWSEPEPVGGFQYGNFISLAHDGGNKIFLAWFRYEVFDIQVMGCQLEDVEPVLAMPLPSPTLEPLTFIEPTLEPVQLPVSEQEVLSLTEDATIPYRASVGANLLLGVLPALLTVLAVAFWQRRRSLS
ncbi:MAG: sialidase family protein [Chloroflexota bacterium]